MSDSANLQRVLGDGEHHSVRVLKWEVNPKAAKAIKIGTAVPSLVFAGWLLQNFLTLRGFVDLVASRIDLAFLALALFVVGWSLTIGFRHARLSRAGVALFSVVITFGLDVWAPKPYAKTKAAQSPRSASAGPSDQAAPAFTTAVSQAVVSVMPKTEPTASVAPTTPPSPRKQARTPGSNGNVPVKPDQGSLFITCAYSTLPSVVPPSGHTFILLTNELSEASGGGGLADYFGLPGAEQKWNNTGAPPFGYRCELTDYTATVLLDVWVQVHLTFREALTVSGQPNSIRQGSITLDRDWLVTIPKIDPGPTGAYTFFIWNCCVKKFVQISMPRYVTSQNEEDGSREQIRVTQPSFNLREPLVPTADR